MTTYFINAGMPGVSAVGRNGERLGLWKYARNHIPAVQKEDFIIWGAWSDSYYRAIRQHKCRQARLVTSSIGQMEMSPGEGVEITWLEYDFRLLEKGVLDYIFFGSKDLYEYCKDRHKGVKWFPYPISFNPQPLCWSAKEDAVGLFVPSHPRKNIQNQIAAAKLAGVKLHSNRYEWLSDVGYADILRRVKAILHVTHTESLGYAVIEAIEAGTLPIVSPCVRDNLGLHDELCVDNPDSAVKISEKILEVLAMNKATYKDLRGRSERAIRTLAMRNNMALRKMRSMASEPYKGP